MITQELSLDECLDAISKWPGKTGPYLTLHRNVLKCAKLGQMRREWDLYVPVRRADGEGLKVEQRGVLGWQMTAVTMRDAGRTITVETLFGRLEEIYDTVQEGSAKRTLFSYRRPYWEHIDNFLKGAS